MKSGEFGVSIRGGYLVGSKSLPLMALNHTLAKDIMKNEAHTHTHYITCIEAHVFVVLACFNYL